MRGHRLLLPPMILAAVALLGAGCGGGGDGAGDETEPTTSTSTSTSTTTVDDGGSGVEPAPDGTRIEVEVRDGAVVGGVQRVEVDTGERVLLVVTSDVADEVHVHGVDVRRDVAAGETVEVEFTADIPGVFEIELEERHLLLVRLVVGG